MEKIFDKLLVEFLIPAVLMMISIFLIIDIIMGNTFNLNEKLFAVNSKDSIVLVIVILFSYIVNISLSSLLHALLRIWVWGKTREYLMYRKLNLFKEENVIKAMGTVNIFFYLYLSYRKPKELELAINAAIKNGSINLYQCLIHKLKKCNISERCYSSNYDIYDTVRTLALGSQDNAIIGWIQYHWSQLRLVRGTLIPLILIFITLPFAMFQWQIVGLEIDKCLLIFLVECCLFLVILIQAFHYYYREKYMIYAMLGYFITTPNSECDKSE